MSFYTLAGRAAVATVAALGPVVAAVSGAVSASATTVHHPSVTVRSLPTSHTSGCPQTRNFAARILSDGPAAVRYHWQRSDGARSLPSTLRFRGAGRHSRTVRESWGPFSGDSSGWEELVVSSPDRVTTHRMYFATYCATGVSAIVGASDSSALCSDVYTDLTGEIYLRGTPPTGVRYYWTVDGTVVGDTTITDPAVLASGEFDPTFQYAFIAPAGSTLHEADFYAETIDGSASDSSAIDFEVDCA
jgi:hypothetical protein